MIQLNKWITLEFPNIIECSLTSKTLTWIAAKMLGNNLTKNWRILNIIYRAPEKLSSSKYLYFFLMWLNKEIKYEKNKRKEH